MTFDLPRISARTLLFGVSLLGASSSLLLASSPAVSPSLAAPLLATISAGQATALPSLEQLAAGFQTPPAEARPWVFWYWMYGSLSREGITADLQAMHDAGLGGACLMSIKAPEKSSDFATPTTTLSDGWWDLVGHAFAEADRLGLKFSMGISDGFATAGGPWITPALSMQCLTSSELLISSDAKVPVRLALPPSRESFYRDLRVLAYPSKGSVFPSPAHASSSVEGIDPSSLFTVDDAPVFRSETACWVQVDYADPQTLRSVSLVQGGANYQANRLRLEASDDGLLFRPVCSLESPRHGWSDGDVTTTHSIPATTARYFRFSWDPVGSEPGGEDLDSAKWKPVLKLRGLRLSSAPTVHQFQGKNNSAWRLAASSEQQGLVDSECLPSSSVLDLTASLRSDGSLDWTPPPGSWTILRIGVTTTARVNATGGAGRGLECDKFSADAVRFQFDHWYRRLLEKAGPDRTPRVLDTLHVDSWECGSQNWSPVLPAEFLRRRGYPLEHYMPVLAGVPLDSVAASEQFLQDYRRTIAELINENFFGTLAALVRSHGLKFSAECTAPVMAADGLAHYGKVDIPMGEFWLRSPTHDKPNDISDAVSGAHIYGHPLVQAEAFTELRMAWDEHPGMLKSLGDLQFARGVNRFMLHVFTHNPWSDRRPGMTLDGIGVYFQRDQTWWPHASAWTSYLSRTQYLLQQGRSVVDLAVFTGEELPSRSLLPDRVIPLLPGLFDPSERSQALARHANEGLPRRTLPAGVTGSANLTDSSTWLAPLQGYSYDSLNPDALVHLARVDRGRLVFPGGSSYALLVLPSSASLQGRAFTLSLEVAAKLVSLVHAGASVLLQERPLRQPGLSSDPAAPALWSSAIDALWGPAVASSSQTTTPSFRTLGQGRIFQGPWQASTLEALAVPPDLLATVSGKPATGLAWTHRELADASVYFVSNQLLQDRVLDLSLRASSASVEVWDALSGSRFAPESSRSTPSRTSVSLRLPPNGSAFVILRRGPALPASKSALSPAPQLPPHNFPLAGTWSVTFSASSGGPEQALHLDRLQSWSAFDDPRVKYYSGTATYELPFDWSGPLHGTELDLGNVANLAVVELNGFACGTLWTPPFRTSVAHALRPGANLLRIQVTNTWANRLIGDHLFPGRPGSTWTRAPWLLEGTPLLPAGLLGPVLLRYSRPPLPSSQPLATPTSSSNSSP